MTLGASAATCDAELNASFRGISYVQSAVWAKLHVGDPGAAGTSNPATNTTRHDVTACFGTSPADDGTGNFRQLANDAVFGPWTSVPATETYSHISFWTASSGGGFIGSGQITAAAVTSGGPFSVPIGDCVIKKPNAA